jgi:RND family efflux transporter MFP subunit
VVTLVAVDSLRVELTVPEADVINVRPGMIVDFHTSAGNGGSAHRGRIRYIGPSVRRQTRDAIVEALVENAGHDLRPGMFVTAKMALGEQSLPAVPQTALRSEGNLRHVFVAAGGRLEDRLVQAAEPQNGQVPILSGLKAGEPVVAELTPDVRDGARVK